MASADGRNRELKYQPILNGPTEMGATVAEVRPVPKYYSVDTSWASDMLNLSGSVGYKGSSSRSSTSEDKEAKNQIINEYALKVSNLKAAYDQGKLNAQDLNIRTRQLTDEYLKQNLVGAKDLYGVQVAAIGTDVSGKLMDNDIARYEELIKYETQQRRERAEQFRKTYAYAADMSDSEVQIEMKRISAVVDNALMSKQQYEDQRALGNPQLQVFKDNADNLMGRAVETNIPMFLANKIAAQPYNSLNTQTLEELRQDCISGAIAYGINAGEASAIVDQALRRSGIVDFVNKKYTSLSKSDEYNKKVIDTMLSTQKLGLYTSVPALQTLASIPPEVLPMVMGKDSDNKLLEIGKQTFEYIQNPMQTPAVDAKGTKAVSQVLGFASKDVSVPSEIPIAQLGMMTNTYTVPTLNDISSMDENQLIKTLDNVNTIVKMYEDPAMQKKYKEVLEVNPALAEQTKIKYVQAKQAQISELIKSMQDSALANNLRYDPKDNTFKLIKTDKDYIWDDTGDIQWKNVYKSLATPYSLQLLDELNKTLNTTTEFVGSPNEVYIKEALSEYSGIPVIDDNDKLMTAPIANTVRKGYNLLFQSTPVTQAASDIISNPIGTFANELFRNPFAKATKDQEEIEVKEIYKETPDDYLMTGIDLENSINTLKQNIKNPTLTQHQKNIIKKSIKELEDRRQKLLV